MNKTITFSTLYDNYQIILKNPSLYTEIITNFFAGGLGACASSDDISVGELAKCWQHEEYHIKCQHCKNVAYITQWAGHVGSGGYWSIHAYCPHCGKEYRYLKSRATDVVCVDWTDLKNILQEERKAIKNDII